MSAAIQTAAVQRVSRKLETAALARTDLARAHHYAMTAKECIFAAQDALSLVWSEGTHGAARRAFLQKLERRLAKVRADLEQLDNIALAFARGGELR